MLKCTFPNCCKARLEPNRAMVPAMQAVRNANGGQPVTVADLAKFALCGRHGHMARKEGVQVFSYTGTATLLERRAAERESARVHFLQLRAKTQMGKAIAKALAP